MTMDAAADAAYDAHMDMDDDAPNAGSADDAIIIDDDDNNNEEEVDPDANVPVDQVMNNNNDNGIDIDIAAVSAAPSAAIHDSSTTTAALATLSPANNENLNQQAAESASGSGSGSGIKMPCFGYRPLKVCCADIIQPINIYHLERNDARVTGIYLNFGDLSVHPTSPLAKRIGIAISESVHLRKLAIVHLVFDDDNESPHPPPFGLPSLFMEIAKNRSIQDFSLNRFNHSYMDIFSTLVPFFKHNHNLRSLAMTSSHVPNRMKVPSIVSALALTSNLEHVDISDNAIDDKRAADIIDALRSMPGLHHLVELNLGRNKIRNKGCTALRRLLRNPANKLQVLLLHENHIDDACIDILYGGLVANKYIKFINLQYQQIVSASGWGVFFEILSSSDCALEQMYVCKNHIGDDGATSLGASLAAKVRMLRMRDCRNITSVGWRGFSSGLRSLNCSLLALSIGGCTVDDNGVVAIASALATNTTLEILAMDHIQGITSAGWREFFRHLTNCTGSRLRNVCFSYNNIDDVGAALLACVLAKMGHLEELSLLAMTTVTANGWSVFADILKSSSSASKMLHKLQLGSELLRPNQPTAISDDVIGCFSGALVGNTSLNSLSFSGCTFSETGFIVLANTLCDKSSIDRTFCSNHALFTFDFFGHVIPDELRSALSLNYNKDKKEVARKKILMCHLNDLDSIFDVFGPMLASALPVALSWLGRDCCEYSKMFLLVQSMPLHILESATEPN